MIAKYMHTYIGNGCRNLQTTGVILHNFKLEGCGGEVGFNSGGSGEVSDKVDIGICVRNVFAEEEDGGVGEWC